MTGPVLDVVVVNWNTGDCLRACLRSLADHPPTAGRYGTVCVVDNASSDDSLDGVDDALGLPLTVLRNPDNRGFGAACNQGAATGDGDLVLFLNPDAAVLPGTLDRVLARLARPDAAGIGICGGWMVTDDGADDTSCARFPTLGGAVARMTGLDRVARRLLPSQRLAAPALAGGGPVDQVIGAFFLIRRSVLTELDGFDERYFLYYEEVDLSFRARQAGYLSWCVRDAEVLHRGAVSTAQVPVQRLFWSWRSRTQYAFAHWSGAQAVALVLLTLLVETPVRALRAARQEPRAAAVPVRAAGRYLGWLAAGRPPAR